MGCGRRRVEDHRVVGPSEAAMVVVEHKNWPPFTGQDQFWIAVAIQIAHYGSADQTHVFKHSRVVRIEHKPAGLAAVNTRGRWFRIPSGNHTATDEQVQLPVAIDVAENNGAGA